MHIIKEYLSIRVMLMPQCCKVNRAQNEMYITILTRAQTFVSFKRLHRYFTCIVQVESYYSCQSTDTLSMVKGIKILMTSFKDVLLIRILSLKKNLKLS